MYFQNGTISICYVKTIFSLSNNMNILMMNCVSFYRCLFHTIWGIGYYVTSTKGREKLLSMLFSDVNYKLGKYDNDDILLIIF
jgi:hypothetical protein